MTSRQTSSKQNWLGVVDRAADETGEKRAKNGPRFEILFDADQSRWYVRDMANMTVVEAPTRQDAEIDVMIQNLELEITALKRERQLRLFR